MSPMKCRLGFASCLFLIWPSFWCLAFGEALDFAAAKPAAEAGDAKAQYALARCYARGVGTVQDYGKAAEYLRRSAEQGYAYAQTDMGALYTKGLGVKTNFVEGVKWYRKAAEQ